MGNYGGLGSYGSLGVYGSLGGPVSDTTWSELPSWDNLLSWFVPGPGTPTGEVWSDLQTWGQLSTWFTVSGSPVTYRYYLTSQSMEQGFPTRDAYGHFLRHRVGKTLVKRDGVWSLVRNKRQDWLNDCDVVLRGGYDNEVTLAQKTELEALGYLIETRTV